jgi:hypothetical protein
MASADHSHKPMPTAYLTAPALVQLRQQLP